ncbi:MAG: 2-C-methyl-D-erythritol 4-phosphate cytidylyltransferase, partial [Clostridia bacterium]|nr:2-C-methyl-D-erythritol 4-phosphate cytidylyltransferase [Clostridia bacterium]
MFENCSFVDKIIIVCHGDFIDLCKSLSSRLKKDVVVVKGGKTRQESVYLGIKNADAKYVLVHDAVRCLVE